MKVVLASLLLVALLAAAANAQVAYLCSQPSFHSYVTESSPYFSYSGPTSLSTFECRSSVDEDNDPGSGLINAYLNDPFHATINPTFASTGTRVITCEGSILSFSSSCQFSVTFIDNFQVSSDQGPVYSPLVLTLTANDPSGSPYADHFFAGASVSATALPGENDYVSSYHSCYEGQPDPCTMTVTVSSSGAYTLLVSFGSLQASVGPVYIQMEKYLDASLGPQISGVPFDLYVNVRQVNNDYVYNQQPVYSLVTASADQSAAGNTLVVFSRQSSYTGPIFRMVAGGKGDFAATFSLVTDQRPLPIEPVTVLFFVQVPQRVDFVSSSPSTVLVGEPVTLTFRLVDRDSQPIPSFSVPANLFINFGQVSAQVVSSTDSTFSVLYTPTAADSSVRFSIDLLFPIVRSRAVFLTVLDPTCRSDANCCSGGTCRELTPGSSKRCYLSDDTPCDFCCCGQHYLNGVCTYEAPPPDPLVDKLLIDFYTHAVIANYPYYSFYLRVIDTSDHNSFQVVNNVRTRLLISPPLPSGSQLSTCTFFSSSYCYYALPALPPGQYTLTAQDIDGVLADTTYDISAYGLYRIQSEGYPSLSIFERLPPFTVHFNDFNGQPAVSTGVLTVFIFGNGGGGGGDGGGCDGECPSGKNSTLLQSNKKAPAQPTNRGSGNSLEPSTPRSNSSQSARRVALQDASSIVRVMAQNALNGDYRSAEFTVPFTAVSSLTLDLNVIFAQSGDYEISFFATTAEGGNAQFYSQIFINSGAPHLVFQPAEVRLGYYSFRAFAVDGNFDSYSLTGPVTITSDAFAQPIDCVLDIAQDGTISTCYADLVFTQPGDVVVTVTPSADDAANNVQPFSATFVVQETGYLAILTNELPNRYYPAMLARVESFVSACVTDGQGVDPFNVVSVQNPPVELQHLPDSDAEVILTETDGALPGCRRYALSASFPDGDVRSLSPFSIQLKAVYTGPQLPLFVDDYYASVYVQAAALLDVTLGSGSYSLGSTTQLTAHILSSTGQSIHGKTNPATVAVETSDGTFVAQRFVPAALDAVTFRDVVVSTTQFRVTYIDVVNVTATLDVPDTQSVPFVSMVSDRLYQHIPITIVGHFRNPRSPVFVTFQQTPDQAELTCETGSVLSPSQCAVQAEDCQPAGDLSECTFVVSVSLDGVYEFNIQDPSEVSTESVTFAVAAGASISAQPLHTVANDVTFDIHISGVRPFGVAEVFLTDSSGTILPDYEPVVLALSDSSDDFHTEASFPVTVASGYGLYALYSFFKSAEDPAWVVEADPTLSSFSSFVVVGAPATHLTVEYPGNGTYVVAGTPLQVTLAARDQYDNIDSSYSWPTIEVAPASHFAGAPSSFDYSIPGYVTFTVTPASTQLTSISFGVGEYTLEASVTVTAGNAYFVAFTEANDFTVDIGVDFPAVTVQFSDQYHNPTYSTPLSGASVGQALVVVPPTFTWQASSTSLVVYGLFTRSVVSGALDVQGNSLVFDTDGPAVTITTTAGSVFAFQFVQVPTFAVVDVATTPITARVIDAAGTTITSFDGGSVTLQLFQSPGSTYTLASAAVTNGQISFDPVTLTVSGHAAFKLVHSTASLPLILPAFSPIAVAPAPPDHLVVGPWSAGGSLYASAYAGDLRSLPVKAVDVHNNFVDAYDGTVAISLLDTSASLFGPNIQLRAQFGQVVFPDIYITRAGLQTIVATDAANNQLTGSYLVRIYPREPFVRMTFGSTSFDGIRATETFYVSLTFFDVFDNAALNFNNPIRIEMTSDPAGFTYSATAYSFSSIPVVINTPGHYVLRVVSQDIPTLVSPSFLVRGDITPPTMVCPTETQYTNYQWTHYPVSAFDEPDGRGVAGFPDAANSPCAGCGITCKARFPGDQFKSTRTSCPLRDMRAWGGWRLGQNDVRCHATDCAGNVSPDCEFSVVLDNSRPRFSSSSLPDLCTSRRLAPLIITSDPSYQFHFSVTDDISGLPPVVATSSVAPYPFGAYDGEAIDVTQGPPPDVTDTGDITVESVSHPVPLNVVREEDIVVTEKHVETQRAVSTLAAFAPFPSYPLALSVTIGPHTTWAQGLHNLTIISSDGAQNAERCAIWFVVDTSPPVIRPLTGVNPRFNVYSTTQPLTIIVDELQSALDLSVSCTPTSVVSVVTVWSGAIRFGILPAGVTWPVRTRFPVTCTATNHVGLVSNPVTFDVYYVPDVDRDGVDDAVDNCPFTANTNQLDSNHDGVGDACQPL